MENKTEKNGGLGVTAGSASQMSKGGVVTTKYELIQGVPEIPDSIWNVINIFPSMLHFHTDIRHVECFLEFSLDGALVNCNTT